MRLAHFDWLTNSAIMEKNLQMIFLNDAILKKRDTDDK